MKYDLILMDRHGRSLAVMNPDLFGFYALFFFPRIQGLA
ncbi:hypothetical protein DVDV_0817 [Desulfovibrio sp. DV]|nr:hypothetical protein DVDV_0817 [Desulfovibrio sp. DV]